MVCSDIFFSRCGGHICSARHSLGAGACRSDGVIVSSTHLLPKTLFIQENMHVPTGKGALWPSSENTSSFITHFPLRTVKYTALINKTENNFNYEEKYSS